MNIVYNYINLFPSDALQAGASQFEASAGKLKRKFWWKNCKVSFNGYKLPVSYLSHESVFIFTNKSNVVFRLFCFEKNKITKMTKRN